MFFITLSCAEYQWQDIIDLIYDRMNQYTNKYVTRNYVEANIVTLANKYSIVVQEYFQERVKVFLETVGKKIFGIDHYWVRYEFSPSRGQIHDHLLAICSKCTIQKQYFKLKKDPKEKNAQDILIAK